MQYNIPNKEAFLAHVKSLGGWSVEEQAASILDGEDLFDQNPAALKIILDVASKRGLHDLGEDIAEFLGVEYDPSEGDEVAIRRMMDDTPSDEDFLRMIDKKFGHAIYQQAKSILDDPSTIDEQNPNALSYISDFAMMHGREDIVAIIQDYLEDDLI